MDKKYDFSGWATRNDIKCSDGRTIRKDAFRNNDGQSVPLVWNHGHGNISNVLGHAILENRDEGVYAYGYLNEDTEYGAYAKALVQHGDITQMSINAYGLKQRGGDVLHGNIREVSLVLAGANKGALIESTIAHGEEADEEAVIFTGEELTLYHSDESEEVEETEEIQETTEEESEEVEETEEIQETTEEESEEVEETTNEDKEIEHSEEDKKPEESKEKKEMDKNQEESKEETVKDVFDTFNDKQKNVVYAMLGQALEHGDIDDEDADDEEMEKDVKHSDEEIEGGNEMKHNVFEKEEVQTGATLSHADQESIIALAKTSSVGSLQEAIDIYAADNQLSHGIDEIETLFPDYKDLKPGAPELLQRDQGWVGQVMAKVHKSPISRIRTRQADVRGDDLAAFGYVKGKEKKYPGNIKLLKRTTDPQTVYRKDKLERDDIIDITDFDVVSYQYGIMHQNLLEELAKAIMIGDGREDGDENKISDEHIRPIWTDDDLYTIHADVDIAAARTELQGTNTNANFGENYVYAEAIIQSALYSREKYKGSGNLDFYCTPHLLNVMLLARDLNGRRIYDSKADLAAALNVSNIQTVEQFEGKTRKDAANKEKKLLGIFVNLSDYQVGSTKGGEITKFEQFDIDFNQYKYLIETRLSGALTRVFSAIVLEEPIAENVG